MITQFFLYQDKNASPLSIKEGDAFIKAHQFPKTESLAQLNEFSAAFEFVDHQLQLWILLDDKCSNLTFNFSEGEVGFRASRVSKSNEVIAKALGCKPHYRPSVLDATAGMGRDAFIMALLGCKVEMQERNFAIYQLLENALVRLQQNSQHLAATNLNLTFQNSIENIAQTNAQVIYLDPMFPERKKSALVKKEMRLFKKLAGDDIDANDLLKHAFNSQAKRVVVKRPKGAPWLSQLKPSHEITAKKFRYDVYLK